MIACVDTHKEYNRNLELVQELVININNYFEDDSLKEIDISKYYTNDFIFHSYPAGNKKGQETLKIDYINSLEKMKANGHVLTIGHSIYLPGINQETFDIDGSVRVYYGASICLGDNSVDFSGYQTIDFRDGKISEMWEWADYGGVTNGLTVLIE